VPAWLWWALALLVVAAAVAVPLVLRSRRHAAWQAELAAAEGEVAWLARGLIPELQDTGSRAALAGGWAVGGRDRIADVEDKLTVLEASAPDEPAGAHARALRDAVRVAHGRLESLAATGTDDTVRRELDEVVAQLEAVLPQPASTQQI